MGTIAEIFDPSRGHADEIHRLVDVWKLDSRVAMIHGRAVACVNSVGIL